MTRTGHPSKSLQVHRESAKPVCGFFEALRANRHHEIRCQLTAWVKVLLLD